MVVFVGCVTRRCRMLSRGAASSHSSSHSLSDTQKSIRMMNLRRKFRAAVMACMWSVQSQSLRSRVSRAAAASFEEGDTERIFLALRRAAPSGRIELESFQRVMVDLGLGVGPASRLFHRTAREGESVSVESLIECLATLREGGEAALRLIFQCYDEDGDGNIQPVELARMFHAMTSTPAEEGGAPLEAVSSDSTLFQDEVRSLPRVATHSGILHVAVSPSRDLRKVQSGSAWVKDRVDLSVRTEPVVSRGHHPLKEAARVHTAATDGDALAPHSPSAQTRLWLRATAEFGASLREHDEDMSPFAGVSVEVSSDSDVEAVSAAQGEEASSPQLDQGEEIPLLSTAAPVLPRLSTAPAIPHETPLSEGAERPHRDESAVPGPMQRTESDVDWIAGLAVTRERLGMAILRERALESSSHRGELLPSRPPVDSLESIVGETLIPGEPASGEERRTPRIRRRRRSIDLIQASSGVQRAELIADLFASIDVDQSGTVSYEQFTKAIVSHPSLVEAFMRPLDGLGGNYHQWLLDLH
jgi:Ca2+-binding EF-hand superfamily protein